MLSPLSITSRRQQLGGFVNEHLERAAVGQGVGSFRELLGHDTLHVAAHHSLPVGVVTDVVGVEVCVAGEAEVEQHDREAEVGELPCVGDPVRRPGLSDTMIWHSKSHVGRVPRPLTHQHDGSELAQPLTGCRFR
jgi:hypothetical protein